MKEAWKNVIVTEISTAVYVAPRTGKHIHHNRPTHGFVLNDADNIKDYVFNDGRIMRTEGSALFYLPQGSSYSVRTLHTGGCYAINFCADITDEPFSLRLRNHEHVLHHFKTATNAWKSSDPFAQTAAFRAVYDAIYQLQKENARQYMPSDHTFQLSPALEMINHDFTRNDLTVSHLAALCGMSEVYFRRLFLNAFGVSPKEYIVQRRIEYAKSLLQSGNFSISEVAQLCGYAESCHFSREFSRRVGVSPSRY